MQLSGVHRRHPAPAFSNHTPRDFEIIAALSIPFQSPEMFGSIDRAAEGAGTIYSGHSTMGQATSRSISREPNCQASSVILREDSIQIEEELTGAGSLSRPDSWSMHCSYTDQAPYNTPQDESMNTATSLLRLPKDNATRDLAFFLRTTGPPLPHRKPSKIGRHSASRKALRFLKREQKRYVAPFDASAATAAGPDDVEFGDAGGLLMPVQQRQTSSGHKYLAVVVDPSNNDDSMSRPTTIEEEPPYISPDIMDSHVSIAFEEDSPCGDVPDGWLMTWSKDHSRHNTPTPPRKSSTHLPLSDDSTVRVVVCDSPPVRPPASNPPTPVPAFAVSMADSYSSDFTDHPAMRSIEACRALSSHPVRKEPSLTALPRISLPKEEFPVKHPSPGNQVEIKHPSPRRFASHPVLLQRASSIATSLYPRSVSDSPGPPPPRSPLRLRRDPRTIESIIATHNVTQTRKATPKLAPSIEPVAEYNEVLEACKPTIVTDCTGPIKRPKSRNRANTSHSAYPASRKERLERSRARKVRDRPYPSRTIDTVVAAPSETGPRRLRKPRPQIQIPLKPEPLVTRASSSASSTASWKKITESTRTPVSPVPSQDSPRSNGSKTGYTPISPTASNGSASARMALSPVMLVAEEIPVPKAKSTPKPAKLILKESKSHAPRPRSASIPRNAMKRRSRTSGQTPAMHSPSRSVTPIAQTEDDTPPLPSPPPNRALPPTPPASGSEKPGKTRTSEGKKELPVPPLYEIAPEPNKHVASQAQRRSGSSKGSDKTSWLDARLAALEKQNKMLVAALNAILLTNGSLNGPLQLAAVAEPDPPKPMVWENHVARRSAASQATSHAASSSNGSALEMYIATRRGIKHACAGA